MTRRKTKFSCNFRWDQFTLCVVELVDPDGCEQDRRRNAMAKEVDYHGPSMLLHDKSKTHRKGLSHSCPRAYAELYASDKMLP